MSIFPEHIRFKHLCVKNQEMYVEKNLTDEDLNIIFSHRSIDEMLDEIAYLKTITANDGSKRWQYIVDLENIVNIRELTDYLVGRKAKRKK